MTRLTRGSLPPRVYWARRLVLLTAVVGLVFTGVGVVRLASGDPREPDQARLAGSDAEPPAVTEPVAEPANLNELTKEIVELINTAGGRAVGLTGQDGGLIRARRLKIRSKDRPDDEIDIGQVGEIESIDPAKSCDPSGET